MYNERYVKIYWKRWSWFFHHRTKMYMFCKGRNHWS